MGLSTAQLGAVEGLVRTAPDALLARLNAALSAARHQDPLFAPVSDIARAEAEDRRARNVVLEPLLDLARADLAPPKRALLAPGDINRFWRLMKAIAPHMVEAAVYRALGPASTDAPPPVYDALCVEVSELLRQADPPPGAAVWPPAERERLAKILMLAPILRSALPKLAGWVRNLNSENMAVVRVAFKDAIATAEDVGPLFIESLQTKLDEPSHVLRIISAVMDRPSDRYLASSELAGIGERLLEDADRRILAVRNFDPNRGLEGGAAEAASVLVACNIAKEFEQWLALSREGPWGSRVAGQKLAVALTVEARMREADKAVAAALPLQPNRVSGGVLLRPIPRLDAFPDNDRVRRASALLAFLEETRTSAANAGFGSLRAQVIEAVEIRLNHYVEDLVDHLHTPDTSDRESARAYLDVAAEFLGLLRGPKFAQIVRRRAAAA